MEIANSASLLIAPSKRNSRTLHFPFSGPTARTASASPIGVASRAAGRRIIESAIKAYRAALSVLSREASPQDWGAAQNNLGIAYEERIRGSRAENLEAAIEAYEAALTVRTREAFPQAWATTQNNLGNAYRVRIQGSQAENLESAIKALEAALTVYTREAFPQDWAMTQNNLGSVYVEPHPGQPGGEHRSRHQGL